jgi:hypothetical protein
MMNKFLVAAVAALPLLTGGCIAKTAFDVVTLPVKAGSQVVDWTTTSQAESDRNYGRRLREAVARDGRERKAHDKACRRNPDNCGPYEGFVAQPGGNRNN